MWVVEIFSIQGTFLYAWSDWKGFTWKGKYWKWENKLSFTFITEWSSLDLQVLGVLHPLKSALKLCLPLSFQVHSIIYFFVLKTIVQTLITVVTNVIELISVLELLMIPVMFVDQHWVDWLEHCSYSNPFKYYSIVGMFANDWPTRTGDIFPTFNIFHFTFDLVSETLTPLGCQMHSILCYYDNLRHPEIQLESWLARVLTSSESLDS